VLLFWQAVQAMNAAQRGKVLKFFTGSARIQVAWMDEAGEQEPPTLRRIEGPSKRRGKSSEALPYPTANTCSNTLNLPPYPTLKLMRQRLLEAAENVEFDEDAIDAIH
jgi:hypothetical protein